MAEKIVTDSSTFEVTSIDDLDLSYTTDVSNSMTSITIDTDTLSQAKQKEYNHGRQIMIYPDFLESTGSDWYRKPCFDRFWRHYNDAMKWWQKHKMRYNSEIKDSSQDKQKYHIPGYTYGFGNNFYNPWSFWNPYGYNYCTGISGKNSNCWRDKRGGKTLGRGSKKAVSPNSKRKMRQSPSNLKLKQAKKHKGEEELEDSKHEEDEFEMEITEEMMEFFTKSEMHRKERDKSKSINQEEKHVDLVGAAGTRKPPTTEAPVERPGARRTSEMTQLYGSGAAMIHGMETALQMMFDRNMDLRQPPFWPNMPLKITF